MLSLSSKPSKKLKVQKPLIFPGHSSSLKAELVDAFNLRKVAWETDNSSCNCLICTKCYTYWIINNTNPRVGSRQSSYPIIGIVDENLPTPTSRTPARWKEHQQTQYHLTAVDNLAKGKQHAWNSILVFLVLQRNSQLLRTTPPLHRQIIPPPTNSVKTTNEVCNNKKPSPKKDLNFCRGAFPDSLLTNDVQQGIIFQNLYYHTPSDCWWTIKPCASGIGGKLVVYSVNCTPNQDISARNISTSSRRTLDTVVICCKNCQSVGNNTLNNRYIRRVLLKRLNRIGQVLSVSKKSVFDFCDRDSLANFIKTNDKVGTAVLSPAGLQLRRQSSILLDYVKSQLKLSQALIRPVSSATSLSQETNIQLFAPGIDNLIHDFSKLLQNNPSFKTSLVVDLLRVVVSRYLGRNNTKLPTQALNFYLALDHKSRKAADFVSSNLMGPAIRSLQRIQSSKRKAHVYQFDEAHAFECLNNISAGYESFTFALQVDATKCPEHIGICQSYGFIAGYAAPHHVLLPSEDSDDSVFSDKTKPKASEIKVAMITIQENKLTSSKSFVIAARPQRPNEISSFTKNMATLSRRWLFEVNRKASFVGTSTDRVSTKSRDIDESNDAFLENRKPDIAMTDNNHNAKSIRQAMLGRALRLGCFHFDTGLLQLID